MQREEVFGVVAFAARHLTYVQGFGQVGATCQDRLEVRVVEPP